MCAITLTVTLSRRHPGIASLVFSHRGSASQRISAARTRIARIFASHRIAISVFSTHRPSHRLESLLCTLHFHKNTYFSGFCGKLWEETRFFQAISDISEPVLGRHHYFSWEIWPFWTLTIPRNPWFFKNACFPGIFWRLWTKTYLSLGIIVILSLLWENIPSKPFFLVFLQEMSIFLACFGKLCAK